MRRRRSPDRVAGPAPRRRGRRVVRLLEVEDLVQMDNAAAADRSWAGLRARAIFRLLADVCVWPRQLAATNRVDLDLGARRLRVAGRYVRDRQVVELPQETAEILGEWIGVRGWHAGPLLTNARGGRLSERSIARTVDAIAEAAGVKACAQDVVRSGLAVIAQTSGARAAARVSRLACPAASIARLVGQDATPAEAAEAALRARRRVS